MITKKNRKHVWGFTLIETIVVMGVVALILPALFGIIYSILKQQVKLYKVTLVKRQGDYAMSIISSGIRTSANEIFDSPGGTQLCSTTGSVGANLYFYDEQGSWFRYYLAGSTLRRQSSVSGISDITSNTVTVTAFSITCSRAATFSTPVVTIQYTVTANPISNRTEDRAQMVYQTRVKMRSY